MTLDLTTPPPGDDYLRLAATSTELRAIVGALDKLKVPWASLLLTQRDGSPWLEVAGLVMDEQAEARPWSEAGLPQTKDVLRLAVWRRTCDVYRVGDDGAVEDDPVWP